MAWKLAVLRKFSTTNHFRLLNQLRNEIKAYPLVRRQKTKYSKYIGIENKRDIRENQSNKETETASKKEVSFNNFESINKIKQNTSGFEESNKDKDSSNYNDSNSINEQKKTFCIDKQS